MNQSEQVRHNELLLQSQSMDNRFSFRRDYVTTKVMSKLEALFIQDLINRATMKGVYKKIVEEKDGSQPYFLCTVEFLERSLDWEHKTQSRLIGTLQEKGFIRVHYTGLPRKRFVWIDILKIEQAVAAVKSSLNGDHCTSPDSTEQSSLNRDHSYTCKNKKQQMKKGDLASRQVPPFSVNPLSAVLKEAPPPACYEWYDQAHAILRSRKPPIPMSTVTRDNGAKYFHELWKRLDEDSCRIGCFLRAYRKQIHVIEQPIPISVRQLCKPEIFTWIERQFGKLVRKSAGQDRVDLPNGEHKLMPKYQYVYECEG